MRYLRITGEPDLAMAPDAFRVIAASEHVQEARLEEYNLGGENVMFLHRVEGDVTAASRALSETAEVESVSVSRIGGSAGYLLLRVDPSETGIGKQLFDLLATSSLVVLTPVVYRMGTVQIQLVGEDAEIQTVMEHLPPSLEVQVHEISGTIPQQETITEQLSERQREAVRVALSVGYYEYPSEATLEDVAQHLDCATSTASEHLRKAEAAVVRTAIVDRRE